MLKGLRCDNDERVWECTYAAAYVQQLPLLHGEGYGDGQLFQRAGEIAGDIADQAVLRLRHLRAGL